MAKQSKEKRTMVKQKDYLGLIAPAHATKLWGKDKHMLKVNDPTNERGNNSQVKVKQNDLMTLITMKDGGDTADGKMKDGKNKSLVKSTKQRRDLFTDGYQAVNQNTNKRTVFSDSDMTHKQNKERSDKEMTVKTTAKVKRFHSPREVSTVLQNCHTSPKQGSKHGRRQLNEENPVDLGAILHDRIKNWSPHIGSSVKGKIPFVGSSSKSYDLLKGNEDVTRSISSSLESKQSNADGNTEIYISLEKKSPREKKDCINQSKAKLFSDYVELNDSSSFDGIDRNEDEHTYSHINKDNVMLF